MKLDSGSWMMNLGRYPTKLGSSTRWTMFHLFSVSSFFAFTNLKSNLWLVTGRHRGEVHSLLQGAKFDRVETSSSAQVFFEILNLWMGWIFCCVFWRQQTTKDARKVGRESYKFEIGRTLLYILRTYTHTHTAKYIVEYCQTVKNIHIRNHAQSIQTCT